MEEDVHIEQQQETQEQSAPAQSAQEQPAGKKPNRFARFIGGEMFQSTFVVHLLPLIGLICVYGLLLVYNRYKVESLTKEKLVMQDSINYLRETRIEMQKHYQETIKISQIAERLDSTGVGITAGPPYEI